MISQTYIIRAIETEERENSKVRGKLEELTNLELARMIGNHQDNLIFRFIVRTYQEIRNMSEYDFESYKAFIEEDGDKYVPTSRENRTARKILVERLSLS